MKVSVNRALTTNTRSTFRAASPRTWQPGEHVFCKREGDLGASETLGGSTKACCGQQKRTLSRFFQGQFTSAPTADKV
jgi:hypothetical protein